MRPPRADSSGPVRPWAVLILALACGIPAIARAQEEGGGFHEFPLLSGEGTRPLTYHDLRYATLAMLAACLDPSALSFPSESPEQACGQELARALSRDGDDLLRVRHRITANSCRSLLPEMRSLSSHPHSRVRATVATILGQLDDEMNKPVLERLLTDEDMEVRLAALRSFCKVWPEECKQAALKRAMDSTDWPERLAAFELCEIMECEVNELQLREALARPPENIAAAALAAASCDIVRTQEERLIDVSNDLLRLPVGFFTTKRELAFAAVRAMGRCPTARGADQLARLLERISRFSREEERLWMLIEAIHASPGVRSAAALEDFVLTHPSPDEAGEVYSSHLPDSAQALKALATLGGRTTIPAIRAGLGDPSHTVRYMALHAATQLGIVADVCPELLTASAREESEDNRIAMKKALESNCQGSPEVNRE